MIENEAPIEPVIETSVEEVRPDFDKLDTRQAIEKSVEILKEGKTVEQARTEVAPTNKEVTRAVEAEIEPPAEFSAAGKAAWKSKDIGAIQKEYRRIHDARTTEITRAQRAEREAKEEGKTYRELAKMAAPYIEARGSDGVSPEKAIMEALALINEFKKGDPANVKAELKKIGIDLDRAPTSTTSAIPEELQAKINALQEVTEEYKRDKEHQQFQRTVQTFDTIFSTLTAQKTRTGDSAFPRLLDNSEEGMEFARELGSRTKDPAFQAKVLKRFPNATLETVVRHAYKVVEAELLLEEEGAVSATNRRVSPQQNQQHIEKSRRAAAATPGRTAPRVNDSNLAGKLDMRAAIAKSIELNRGN